MPTLAEQTQRLELNQSSRIALTEQLSGEKIIFYQGVASQIKCALFNDTPSATSFISTVSNIDAANIVVRKHGPNGDILFTEETSSFTTISYNSWSTELAHQFVFDISILDTTQIVPTSGRLPIYFVVTVTTGDGVPYIAGFGYGEIVDVGFIENPVSSDYITGRTPIVGGKLLTNLNADGYNIVNLPLSGVEFIETGQTEIGTLTFPLTLTIPFLYEKASDTYIFQWLYVKGDILMVEVVDQTTTNFTVLFERSPVSDSTLFWGVAILDPTRASQPGTSGPRYLNESHAVSVNQISASRNGIILNADLYSETGTDMTDQINELLAGLEITGGTFILDGPAKISGSLRTFSNVTIFCPDKNCGVRLANGSNCHMVVNSAFGGVTNPSQPVTRQENISIIGGTWNGNYMGQSYHVANNVANSGCCGMWFNGVDNLRIENVTIYDARVFALMLTYHGHTSIIDYTAQWPIKRNDNNDCIHTWGPATTLYGRGPHFINGNDDSLALNYTESGAPGNGGVKWFGAFTVVAATDLFTSTAHALVAGNALRIETTGTLPGGLLADKDYYISATGLTANDFKVSATRGGATQDVTSVGTGTHTWRLRAYVSVDIDQVVIENPCSIMRVDSVDCIGGTISVRNLVTVDLGYDGGAAGVLLANGTWDRLRCENWTIKTFPGAPFDWPKNVILNLGNRCGDTEFVNWNHNGISATTGDLNFIKVGLINVATPMRKLLLDRVIVNKPSASRIGALVEVTGSATALALKQIEIRNCALDGTGYAYLYANASGQAVVGAVVTDNTNQLNGAISSTGLLPLTLPDCDELNTVGAYVTTSVDLTIVNNTAVPLLFNTEINDSHELHSTVTNTSRLVAKVPGKYDVDTGASFELNGSGLREIRFVYNRGLGSELILKRNLLTALTTDDTIVNLTCLGVRLGLDDYVEVIAVQTSGATLVVRSGAYFSMTRRR